jgi:antitoxin CptB
MNHEELLILKKKLIYRSCHRGCKETDFILGKFVTANINNLTLKEIQLLADLLKESDTDIYKWVTGQTILPSSWKNSLMEKIINFNRIKNIV